MTTEKAVDPQFLPDLEAACEAQDIKAVERKQLLAELKQFSDLPTYDQYKLWTAARLTVNPSLFQTCLKDLSFFLDPLWADWSVKTVLGDQYQHALENARVKAQQQQLSDIIVIQDPMLLQNTLLSGLLARRSRFCCLLYSVPVVGEAPQLFLIRMTLNPLRSMDRMRLIPTLSISWSVSSKDSVLFPPLLPLYLCYVRMGCSALPSQAEPPLRRCGGRE
jgi:hypothetical protein